MNPEQQGEETQVQSEFATHILNEEGIEKALFIAERFSALILDIENVCIDGREFSICRTKLEEACFFAKKSMATNLINQKHN